jgi:hypothetical protein
MSTIVTITVQDILPDRESILRAQGITDNGRVSERISGSVDEAIGLFEQLAKPRAITREISAADFGLIYQGLGQNEQPGPIEEVYRQGRHLTAFAATVGPSMCVSISELFTAGEFVLGNCLDAAASEGADRISTRLETMFAETLVARGIPDDQTVVFAYSPGYCGWHISAQRALFGFLRPEQIGITLRESFLMEPLKSISGALIAGPRNIHIFEGNYPFCAQCRTQPCRARIDALNH